MRKKEKKQIDTMRNEEERKRQKTQTTFYPICAVSFGGLIFFFFFLYFSHSLLCLSGLQSIKTGTMDVLKKKNNQVRRSKVMKKEKQIAKRLNK